MANFERFPNELIYLKVLEDELRFLPKKQRIEALQQVRTRIHYKLDSGSSMQETIESLETPFDLARSIYESGGKAYLAKRQNVKRRNEVLTGIFGAALLVFLLVITLALLAYFGVLAVNRISLLSILIKQSFLDFFIMTCVVLALFTINFVIGLYLTDGLLILGRILVKQFLAIFHKTIPDSDFLLTTWLVTVTKKKKIVETLAGVGFLGYVFFMGCGFMVRSYPYYSLSQAVDNSSVVELPYSNEDLESMTKIEISGYEGKVILKSGESFQINYYHPYISEVDFSFESDVLKVTFITSKTYDFLNLLKEPLQAIEVIVPETPNLSVIRIDAERVNLEVGAYIHEIEIESYIVSLTTKDASIDSLKIKATRLDIYSQESIIGSCDLSLGKGSMVFKKNEFTTLIIDNYGASLGINETTIDNFTFTNEVGTFVLRNSNVNILDIVISNCIMDLKDSEIIDLELTAKVSSSITIDTCKITDLVCNSNGGYLTIRNCTGDVVIETGQEVSIVRHKGNLDLKLTGGTLALNDCLLDMFNLVVKNSKVADIVNLGVTKTIAISSENTTLILKQMYGETISIYCISGQVIYDNFIDEREKLVKSEDEILKNIYTDSTKIKFINLTGNIATNHVEVDS